MNRLGRAVLNSPARAVAQRRFVLPTMQRLGGALDGERVLEVGCGRGAGSVLVVTQLGARAVDAIDIDPVMVRLATRRVAVAGLASHIGVAIGDMARSDRPDVSYDAVVDMGAIHLEPRWRDALAEVRRVLRPGGRFYFEEIVRPGRQAVSSLATGARLPRDFARESLMAELDVLGFVLVGSKDVGWQSVTGLVGDVIGVATRPGPG